MATKIMVPSLGESVVDATVSRWLKKEGEAVAAHDAIVELETDKVNLEVTAEESGVLARIAKQAGEDVKVGDVLGEIQEEGGQQAAQPSAASPARQIVRAEPEHAASAPATAAAAAGPAATPSARRLAVEHGIALEEVPGSGSASQITRQDIETYVMSRKQKQDQQQQQKKKQQQPAAAAAAEAAPPGEREPALPGSREPEKEAAVALPPLFGERGREEQRVPMSRRRKTIARRLLEAQHTAAMLTTYNEVDMTAVMALREKMKETFEKRHGVHLGIASFFVKASIGALKAFPMINAELQGEEIVYKHYYDIGVAVGAEEGLVVPVLRDADRMTFAEIERKIREFVQKSQDGSLSLEDLQGGTFTITNGGVFGSLLSTPILNPPQVAILGLHKIEQRPVIFEGQVAARSMMYVAVSYDHRVVDGRESVQFLARIKELIEAPDSLLLEA